MKAGMIHGLILHNSAYEEKPTCMEVNSLLFAPMKCYQANKTGRSMPDFVCFFFGVHFI